MATNQTPQVWEQNALAQATDSSINHDSFSCEEIYVPQQEFSQLYLHNLVEICLIVSGEGILHVFDQSIPCKAGDVHAIPPNTPHKYYLASPGDKLIIRRVMFDIAAWFSGDITLHDNPRFCYGLFNESTPIACAILNSFTRDRICAIYDAIECELLEQKNEWKDAVRGYLAHLMINVARYIDYSIKNTLSTPSKEWAVVLSAIKLIKERHCERSLTLKSIADTLYISESHLSRMFTKLTGQHFSDYLRNIRFEQACTLLERSTLTIEEIVRACGLSDVPTFYRTFNKYKQMTPQEYRNSANPADASAKVYTNFLKGEKIMSILNDISINLQQGKAKIVKGLVQQALDEGVQPTDILNEGLLAGMNVIGEKFKNNEIFVPEVLVAARAMNMGTQTLKPYLKAENIGSIGKVCLGTVQGDLHDIGKNLVRMMMEGKGLEVIDLGVDVPAETFIQTAIEQNCQIICCSALLTTTMHVMEEVVKAAEEAGIRDKVKIMVGGAPVTEAFCKKIGADRFTRDAASAADAALELCKM